MLITFQSAPYGYEGYCCNNWIMGNFLEGAANNPARVFAFSALKSKTGILAGMDSMNAERCVQY